MQQQGANGYVGCCLEGSNCAGPVPLVSTVTITAQAQQTVPVIYPQQYTTTPTHCPNCYSPPPAAAGFCQTLTMRGPGLPVVTQGQCGTILIVNESSRNLRPVGLGVVGIFFTMQLAVARMFRVI